MGEKYQQFYRRSIEDRDGFWTEQAALIDWHKPFDKVLQYDKPPFARWFVGGQTNLCHNAVDRHLTARGKQAALVYISTETDSEKTYSYEQLHQEVTRCAAVLRGLGVGKGDGVLIYMPMIPEAIFAMLACARLGAIHSVVFGGFAPASLALRIDDARPKVMVTADAGMRAGRVIPYKNLVDEALRLAKTPPKNVVIVNRGLVKDMPLVAGRDMDYATLVKKHDGEDVPVTWLESSEPSYILYTSGTTGKPKGVQRDTGGYAVALAASMKHIYCGAAGETMFTTSDIGWALRIRRPHGLLVFSDHQHRLAALRDGKRRVSGNRDHRQGRPALRAAILRTLRSAARLRFEMEDAAELVGDGTGATLDALLAAVAAASARQGGFRQVHARPHRLGDCESEGGRLGRGPVARLEHAALDDARGRRPQLALRDVVLERGDGGVLRGEARAG